MSEIVTGAVFFAVVIGLCYAICRAEIARQLGEDYRSFVYFCRLQGQKAEEESRLKKP